MANRSFTEFRHSIEKRLIDLFGHIGFGATGAPTLSATDSKGVSAVTRISAGMYLITFVDRFVKLVHHTTRFVGPLIPASPLSHVAMDCTKAAYRYFGVAAFSSVVATNKVTINGHDFTAVASGASGDQFNVGVSDTATAANAAAAINASTTSGVAGLFYAYSCGPVLWVISNTQPYAFAKTGATITLTPSTGNLSSSPAVLVQFTNSSGTPTDPAAGEVCKFNFTFRDSSI